MRYLGLALVFVLSASGVCNAKDLKLSAGATYLKPTLVFTDLSSEAKASFGISFQGDYRVYSFSGWDLSAQLRPGAAWGKYKIGDSENTLSDLSISGGPAISRKLDLFQPYFGLSAGYHLTGAGVEKWSGFQYGFVLGVDYDLSSVLKDFFVGALVSYHLSKAGTVSIQGTYLKIDETMLVDRKNNSLLLGLMAGVSI